MRFYRMIKALIMILLFAGCGNQGGTLSLTVDSPAAAPPVLSGGPSDKPLRSLWTESNNNFQLDLRTTQMAVLSDVTIKVITGQNCICKVLIQGSEASGNMNLSNCAGSYPYCSSFNSPGTYTKLSSDLQICLTSNSCTSLK